LHSRLKLLRTPYSDCSLFFWKLRDKEGNRFMKVVYKNSKT
jgi:hypothetical protein